MNVIVIITDSLRRDHVGCYGNDWIQTPNLDRFAAEATLIEHAYTEGLPTVPFRLSLLTGRFTFPFRGWVPLDAEERPMPEYLWDKGYRSALISDVYHLHKPGMNFARGFDDVKWIRGQEWDPFVTDPIDVPLEKFHKPRPGVAGGDAQMIQYLRNRAYWKSEEDHFIAQVVKAGLEWIDAQVENDKFFLYLDCFDPHEPWDPPSPYDRMYGSEDYDGPELICPMGGTVEGYLSEEELDHVKALYAGEVTLVDRWVGIFLDGLRERGFFENSLVIHVSDHGEPFGEHGIVRKMHCHPYEELAHIPLIVYHPEGLGKGMRVPGFVETCDIMPTILDFLEIPSPETVQGASMLPLLRGDKDRLRDYACCGQHKTCWSIKNERWSYMCWLRDGREELYDREEDFTEQQDVVQDHPETAKQLRDELFRFVGSIGGETPEA